MIDNNGSLYELETQIMQCFDIDEGATRKFESSENLEYTGADVFNSRVEELRGMTETQCSYGNWNYAPYMHGMANGMILALAVLEGETHVDFKEAPTEFLCDRADAATQLPENNWVKDSNEQYRHVIITEDGLYLDGELTEAKVGTS